MGFLDKLTGKSRRKEQERLAQEAEAEKQRKAEERKAKREAKKAKQAADAETPKAKATAAGEPWVAVLSFEADPNDPSQGAFELDWNDKFVANLVRAGYQGKTDQDIVDNWFKNVCRNVVMETYEQEMADPDKRVNQAIQRKDIGGGKAEFS